LPVEADERAQRIGRRSTCFRKCEKNRHELALFECFDDSPSGAKIAGRN
jgi:hypothetical protein